MKVLQGMKVFLLSAAVAVTIMGCGSSETASGKVYYLIHDDTGTGFNEDLKQGFLTNAKGAGVETEVLNAQGDTNLQLDQMNQAMDEKAGVIVLAAVDGDAIVPAVKKANEAGIPIVRINRDINDGKFVASVSDDREAGKMQGEYMAKNLPQGAQIVYFGGEMTQGGARKRWEGFKEACLDKRPDIKLIGQSDCGWQKVNSLKQMTLWLKLFPKIDGVVAANDDMALGAVQAMKDAGRLDGVLVSGVDATGDALKAIAAGSMSQTVMQDAKGQGEGAFSLVQAFFHGEHPAEDLLIPFVSITKENLSQYAK
jgi:inositol transport system substrate-binding protein